MHKIVVALVLSLVVETSFASAISCRLLINGSEVNSIDVEVSPSVKTKVMEYEGLVFFVTEKESPRYLLEIFNPLVPSRSYSEGVLITEKDELLWSYWDRDIWIDYTCSLSHQ